MSIAHSMVSAINARLIFHDWHDDAQRFRCTQCAHVFSAHIDTAYAGTRTNEDTYQSGLRQGLCPLDSGSYSRSGPVRIWPRQSVLIVPTCLTKIFTLLC